MAKKLTLIGQLTRSLRNPKTAAKALVGLLAPLLTGLAEALLTEFTPRTIIFTLLGGAITCVVVWATPNEL